MLHATSHMICDPRVLFLISPQPQVYVERFWYNCNFRLSRNNEAGSAWRTHGAGTDEQRHCHTFANRLSRQILVCQNAMAECDRWLDRFDALEAAPRKSCCLFFPCFFFSLSLFKSKRWINTRHL